MTLLCTMLYKVFCATCIGIDAVTVTVEVDMSPGVGIHLVGLPDSAVRESLLRVFTALGSYGFTVPGRKIIVNLAPADMRKEGSAFDLAIALGIIAVSEKVSMPHLGEYVIMGELALDGTVRPVPGALPAAIHARDAGFRGCILPRSSAEEAVDIENVRILGVDKLSQVIDILSLGEKAPAFDELLVRPSPEDAVVAGNTFATDFRDVRGQAVAKRGMEIAAAGGHNLILVGSPGSGKSLLASCLPSILPPMTREESIQTSKIYSIAGERWEGHGLMRLRPFRTPHHSASLVSLVGGGQNPMPGEISLAHNGVLYLDEMLEFPGHILDALRQPVENGRITLSRARYKVEYPASFMLVASMNPCPCGYYGDPSGRCCCTRASIERYMSRLSGPMLDRIDMQIFVRRVPGGELVEGPDAEPSAVIASRVLSARRIQEERFRDEGIFTNSQMNVEQLRRHCSLGDAERGFLRDVVERLGLSARGYSRILKLARTIADLDGNNFITLQHISEAVQYRNLDRFLDND